MAKRHRTRAGLKGRKGKARVSVKTVKISRKHIAKPFAGLGNSFSRFIGLFK